MPQDSALKFGDPPIFQHSTPNGEKDVSQRLMPFPFTPPDVKLKDGVNLSSAHEWFTEPIRKKIDDLGQLDFYAASGPGSVAVVPKLHNTSAGIEIYQLDPPLNKATFEQKEGPFRAGITKKFSNKRDGKKIAKFKVGTMAESGRAAFCVSRLLGHLVEVLLPPIAPWPWGSSQGRCAGYHDGTSGMHRGMGESAKPCESG